MRKVCCTILTAMLVSLALCGCGGTSVKESGNSGKARALVQSLAAGDFKTPISGFDENMKKSLPAEALGQAWRQLQGGGGAYRKISSVRTEKAGGYDIVYVKCEFEKSLYEVKLAFDSGGKVAGLFFLPATATTGYKTPPYVDPGSFSEKQVTVGGGEWKLPGTLSMPNGNGPFPAIVLVHGSGPNDRDETVGPNKPFKDLAGGLASQGVAVLRYEKRTREYQLRLSTMANSVTTREEVTDDAVAAVNLLRKTPGISKDRVYILGHSLGGMLVPRLATLDPQVHGFVILAGPTRPFEDLILEQTMYIASLDGSVSADEQAKIDMLKAAVARVKDPSLSPATPMSELPLGIQAKYWLDLRGYSPAQVAKGIEKPMLIVWGERDYQVSEADFQGWKDALSGKKNVKLKTYPRLNHMFIEGQGKGTPAEYQQAGHVAPYVVDDIAAFVKEK